MVYWFIWYRKNYNFKLFISDFKKKFKVLKIDGDKFRKKSKNQNKFTIKNILKNNFKIIEYLKKKQRKYDFILVSVISPLSKTRYFAKYVFKKNYHEAYVNCSFQDANSKRHQRIFIKRP